MFLEVLMISVFDVLPLVPLAVLPVAPPGTPVAIWVLAETVPVTLRVMFT